MVLYRILSELLGEPAVGANHALALAAKKYDAERRKEFASANAAHRADPSLPRPTVPTPTWRPEMEKDGLTVQAFRQKEIDTYGLDEVLRRDKDDRFAWEKLEDEPAPKIKDNYLL